MMTKTGLQNRRAQFAADAAKAMEEYLAEPEAIRVRTARLRALRLERDAVAAAHYTPFARPPSGSGEAAGQVFKFYSDPYAPFAPVPNYSELELHFATLTHLDQTSWIINVIENGSAGSKVSQGFVLRTTIDPVPLPPASVLFLGLLTLLGVARAMQKLQQRCSSVTVIQAESTARS
jgi:hypothetical protein